MNVLVTGGAGFIGSSLVDRILAEGHHVEVVDDLSTGTLANLAAARSESSGRLKIHQSDVRSEAFADLVARRSPEVVYHLAGLTDRSDGRPSPAAQAGTDVVGTVRLLDGARRGGCRKVVVAGSARHLVDAGAGRMAAEAVAGYLAAYRQHHGIESTTIVLPTVFGPRQRPGTESSVVAVLAGQLVREEPCTIHGTGAQTRDLLYVDDAVDALVKAAEKADGLTVEVGTGHQTSIASLLQALAAVVGRTCTPTTEPVGPDEPGAVPVDPGRAELYLGWRSWTPLAEALIDTVVAVPPPPAP